MSKSRNNIPRAAIHVGAPAKSFSAAEGYEPERRGWDEKTYRLKNQDTNNHYDFSRKHLNFEINGKGEIVPLGSNPVPLHERLQKRLDELGFKPYMDKNNPLGISDNSPNCTVGIIVSGDHRVLTRLAYGDQDVDFTLQKSNAHVVLERGIKDWALDIKEEALTVPTLDTNPLAKKAVDDILEELGKPIPAFGQKEWREERRKAIKAILTELQTALMEAKEVQKKDILMLGKSLYNKAMKDTRAIIEQNKRLQKENHILSAENVGLKKRISSMDENVIHDLRKQKDAEIERLQKECDRANSHAVRSDNLASKEHQRADDAVLQIREMLAVPEIKELWNGIQQNKKAFWQQVDQWIADAKQAIYRFATDYQNAVFTREYANPIGQGILAEALKDGLDASDKEQRKQATLNLLNQVSWKGTTKYMSDLSETRTMQFCEEMTVPKNLMDSLLLAAGGRGVVCAGGGGSNNELTNWDGTKKNTGWGVSY